MSVCADSQSRTQPSAAPDSTSHPSALMRTLHRRLRDDGLAPWLDEEDLLAGEDWRAAIGRAMRAAMFVVVCLSVASTARAGYVHKEIELALDVAAEQPEGSIFVVPARLEECRVPDRLRHLHWVDLFADGGYERLTRVLMPDGSVMMPPAARPARRPTG